MALPTLFHRHFPDAPPGILLTQKDPARVRPAIATEEPLRRITPRFAAPTLVSSFAGRIDALLLMMPDYLFEPGADDGNAYRSLLAALPTGTKFIVVHHESIADRVRDLIAQHGHEGNSRLVPVTWTLLFSDWAQDPFVGISGGNDGRMHLLKPYEFIRQADHIVAELVERDSDLSVELAPVIFEGGNCLVGDDYWLWGIDDYQRSEELINEDWSPVRGSIDDLIGEFLESEKTLHLVQTASEIPESPVVARKEGDSYFLDYAYTAVGTRQPVFHIDMFITLGGREDGRRRILVGSPALAAELTGGPHDLYGLQAALDDVANRLSEADFDVIRNPLPMVHYEGEPSQLSHLVSNVRSDGEDDNERRQYENVIRGLRALGARNRTMVMPRHWYHATANNCLVQESARHGNRVYIPTYGHGDYAELAVIDQYMEELWRDKLGFTPFMLGNFHAHAQRQGSVHCMTKYLSRGD